MSLLDQTYPVAAPKLSGEFAMLFGLSAPHDVPNNAPRRIVCAGVEDSAGARLRESRRASASTEKERITVRRAQIVELVFEHGEMTFGDIEEELGVSRCTVENDIRALRRSGEVDQEKRLYCGRWQAFVMAAK